MYTHTHTPVVNHIIKPWIQWYYLLLCSGVWLVHQPRVLQPSPACQNTWKENRNGWLPDFFFFLSKDDVQDITDGAAKIFDRGSLCCVCSGFFLRKSEWKQHEVPSVNICIWTAYIFPSIVLLTMVVLNKLMAALSQFQEWSCIPTLR